MPMTESQMREAIELGGEIGFDGEFDGDFLVGAVGGYNPYTIAVRFDPPLQTMAQLLAVAKKGSEGPRGTLLQFDSKKAVFATMLTIAEASKLKPGAKAFTLGAPGPLSTATITALKVGAPIPLR